MAAIMTDKDCNVAASRTSSMGTAHGALAMAKVLICALLALAMSMVVSMPAKAYAAKDPYTYTVRLYAGAQGTFADGADRVALTNLKMNDVVSFHQGDVILKNDQKYYVRGWKVSGRDNDTSSELLSALKVTKDLDLVVSYGILGENVGYTVRYVDLAGNELYPTEHFYGNIGESPMLAYRYIEGYTPQAYNLTGELLADESQNVYTFTYTPIPEAEQVTVIEPVYIETPAPAAAPAAGGAAAPAVPAADAPVTAVEAPTADIPDDANPLAGPDAIQDIRDDETPLASGISDGMFANREIGDEAFLSNPPLYVSIAGLVILAGVVVGLALYFRKRRKDNEAAMSEARASIAPNGQAASAMAGQPAMGQPMTGQPYYSQMPTNPNGYPGQFGE